MSCDTVQAWIWENPDPGELPAPAAARHLAGCAACLEELAARRSLAAELRSLRVENEELPSRELDARVLAVAAAAAEAAALDRPARVHPIRAGMPTQRGPVTLDATAPVGRRPAASVPSASWMLALAALLGFALLLGFGAGRATVPGGALGGPALHTTLASTSSWRSMHRPHQVSVPAALMEQISNSQTYVMTGPVGGPYEVVGKLRLDELGSDKVLPLGGLNEVVVAVSPERSWDTGKQLAMNDLAGPGVEILGRRKLDRGRPAVVPTAP